MAPPQNRFAAAANSWSGGEALFGQPQWRAIKVLILDRPPAGRSAQANVKFGNSAQAVARVPSQFDAKAPVWRGQTSLTRQVTA